MGTRMVKERDPSDMKGMASAESRRFKVLEFSRILNRCKGVRDMKG